MKTQWILLATLVVLGASFTFFVACGDDDDDSGGDDDVASADDCQGMCERGYECFSEDFWDYAEVDSMEDCVQNCEDDLAGADPELAQCIFECSGIADCQDWAACTADCTGYSI